MHCCQFGKGVTLLLSKLTRAEAHKTKKMKKLKETKIRSFGKVMSHLAGIDTGWGNGYAVIPKGHPMHGKHYDEINVDVHYGLTFSASVDELNLDKWPEITDEDKGGWVVGFDTAHLGDDLARWPQESVEAEAKRLAEQLDKLGK